MFTAIIVTFLASLPSEFNIKFVHTEIRIEYYQETSRRVIGGKSIMRTLSSIGLPQLRNKDDCWKRILWIRAFVVDHL